MVKLIQLPNGDQVNPRHVKMIRALPEEGSSAYPGTIHAPRVVVTVEPDYYILVNCDSYEAACQLRDDVARQVREAGR